MQAVSVRYEAIQKTLEQLDEALKQSRAEKSDKYFDIFRDAAIHRFKLSVNPFWKYLKAYLDRMGITLEVISPIDVFKACVKIDLINKLESEMLDNMLEDRMRISQAYDPQIANDIYNKIPIYYDLMKIIIERHPA